MKARNYVLIVCTLFALSKLSAQPYFKLLKDGRSWVYTEMVPGEEPAVHIRRAFALSMQGDTLIQGNSYKKIYQHILKTNDSDTDIQNPKEILNTYLYGLMREDTFERKIYWLPFLDILSMCESGEHLLYDFSLEEGDTLNNCVLENLYEPWMPFVPRVDSIRPYVFSGLESRAFYTEGIFFNGGDQFYIQGRILEGFGYEIHGLINYGRNGFLVLFQYFCEGDSLDCELLSAIEEPGIPKSEFSLSPNPADYFVFIRTDQTLMRETTLKISFLNAIGNVVLQANWNDQNELKVDVSQLIDGIYLLNIYGQRINTSQKILISH